MLVRGPRALVEWRESQRLEVPGAEWTPRYRAGRWDGTYAPGQYCREVAGGWELRCSRGLASRLMGAFPDIRIPGVVAGGDEGQQWLASHPKSKLLRPHQLEAFLAAIEQRWGRIAQATNAGKGAVIALLAACTAGHNRKVVILCDEIAVFDALEGELKTWGNFSPALVNRGVKDPPHGAPVVLAMVPTLHRRLSDEDNGAAWREWAKQMDMCLLDEADKATAPTWRAILGHMYRTHWRIGFSGSFPDPRTKPYEDLVLEELMGPVLARYQNKDAIEDGISAKPTVELCPFDVSETVGACPKDWWWRPGSKKRQAVFEASVVFNQNRHAYIASLVQPNIPTALVVNRIVHGEQLAAALPGAEFVDGSYSPKQRLEALEAFQKGKLRILIVTKILDRGTNRLGSAADLFFVSGEGSVRQTLQRVGRGLRRAGGKEFLRLVDIVDKVNTEDSNKYVQNVARYLHEAGKKRVQLYRDEGFEIVVRKQS